MPTVHKATPNTPNTLAGAKAIAERLAATVDRAMGGPVTRAFEKLLPPVDRYQANGVVAGTLADGQLTTLDGESFPAELAPVLRKWLAKHPEASERPARWIVYPRTLEGGLAFYVLGQRQALAGETEAQINREIDRFTVTGTLLNSRGMRKQTCVRICRNQLTPKGQKKHPNWRMRLLFLAGLPPAPTKSWWNTDVRIQARREGRALVILAMAKVGAAPVHQELPLGPINLPWPWRPSSQSIWRLCQREGLATVPPWPCTDEEADAITRRFLAVTTALLTDIAPAALGRQADRADPKKRAELETLGRHHVDLLRQWLARTNQFLAELGEKDPAALATLLQTNQLKQRLAMAMAADLEGVFEQEGDHFWFEGRPVRGRAARVLRENLPLATAGTLGGIEAQEAQAVPTPKTKPKTKPKAAPTTKKAQSTDEAIEALMAQAVAENWSDQLLHLRITKTISDLIG